MTDDTPETPYLSDLNVQTVRQENASVDDRISELESDIEELEDEVGEKADRIEDLEEEKNTAEKLLTQLRDSEREKHLARIREANEQVTDDEEVDLSAFDDADPDQLATVADMVEQAAGAEADVSNTGEGPDISDVEGADDDLGDALDKAAENWGLSSSWEKAKNDDFGNPEGFTDPNSASNDEPSYGDLVDALAGGDD